MRYLTLTNDDILTYAYRDENLLTGGGSLGTLHTRSADFAVHR